MNRTLYRSRLAHSPLFSETDSHQIQVCNKDNGVLRAGCQSPLSIRLYREHSWISPDTFADVSQGAPPGADRVCVTPTLQQHPVITHKGGLGDGGTVTAWLLDRMLPFQREQKYCLEVTLISGALRSRAGRDRCQQPSASLAGGSWFIIGINVTVCHSNLIKIS